MENENKIFSKLNYIYLAGFIMILALPLLNLPPWFSPPNWGKTVVFRIILSVLIFFVLYQCLHQKDGETARHMARRFLAAKSGLLLLIALLFVSFLSFLFSADRNFSLWGDPYRAGGLINFAFYIILAIFGFLVLRKSDWQKIWDCAILAGIFVALIAIFQQWKILSSIFIPSATQLSSTIGGPAFLGIYLLLLCFPCLSFGLKEKLPIKKGFYFIALILFLFVILMTLSQAAYVGLAAGALYFLFFYPKKLLPVKIISGVLIILGIFGAYFLKTHPELPLSQNDVVSTLTAWNIDQSRISAWKVSLEAIKARPILGFGPENFSTGFDKYYDPSLPLLKTDPNTFASWWDRAHNFVFDIGVTFGIPALLIYLAVFFFLFWQIQKLKNHRRDSDNNDELSPVVMHGTQSAFLAYLAANFFSFDTFSSYLISFLLVGYALHILAADKAGQFTPHHFSHKSGGGFTAEIKSRFFISLIRFKDLILFSVLICLVLFIWIYNIKPFRVNSEINITRNLVDRHQSYDQAITRLEKEMKNSTILDHYLRLQYVDTINGYLDIKPELAGLIVKSKTALFENTKTRPGYTRNWLLLGAMDNNLLEKEMDPETREKLKKETSYFLEKARELSPKRQEVFIELIKTDLVTGDYQAAREKAEECVKLNQSSMGCQWLMGLVNLYFNETDEAEQNIQFADEMGYETESKHSILQLIRMYGDKKDFQKLAETYKKLIALDPKNPQHHASLAAVYKELGDWANAREEALKILELAPETKEQVEEFLRTLR